MNSKQNFIKGTAILMGANAISKILGAVFKIPLTYILEEEGMAIFNTAMGVYSTLLSFIISGFPLAISRLIATEYALENYSNIKKIIRISVIILSVLGLLGTLILFWGSDFFAYSMKDPKAALSIKTISPSVFLVALGCVFKSYFQGCVNMVPTAISQIIESFIRLAIGFYGAWVLKNSIIEITSAGAISGITIGEFVATLILFILFFISDKKLKKKGNIQSNKAILNSISQIAFPMLICSCISSAFSLLDVATVRNSLTNIRFTAENVDTFLLKYSSYTTIFDNLKETLKMPLDGARWLYGAYTGYALTIFHLPTGIIGALGTSIFPVISGAYAKNNIELLKRTLLNALQVTITIILPCALILYMFSDELLYFLFKNTASAHLLSLLAPALIFLCITDLFVVTLHAFGKIYEPFLYSLIGMFIKLLANIFLIPVARLNIEGAIIGSTLSFFIMMIINGRAVIKYTKINKAEIMKLFRPIVSLLVMYVILRLIKEPLNIIFTNEIIALFISLSAGGLGYLMALISTDCLGQKKI
ncbi:MAG: polysaccharide biosynthesis protein [Clostridia bacterium]|nr:polysaccharide biosynthesis protein [Clostridia bacterium]